MKRLRYILSSFVLCIELELEPTACYSENQNIIDRFDGCGCPRPHGRCFYPEGHPGKHCDDLGQSWD